MKSMLPSVARLVATATVLSSLLIGARVIDAGGQDPDQTYSPTLYRAMKWRNIGPFRGGRATAVAGVPGQPMTFFQGASGGGLWRTEDAGNTWVNVSDGFFGTGSVGAVAIAPSDAQIIYVGTGEGPPRGQASSDGDGIYKSTDRGDTWKHIGLEDTLRIARVRVHPKNPDIVYVAAQGSPWGPNKERGIYRSMDGGESWDLILHVDERTGACDLSMDGANPRVLYAALWEHQRTPWKITSGGPGSGLYKSSDGGDNWTRLTGGLPEGVMGKIGVAVSPVDPDRVWAIIEAEEGGLYRSDDGGKSWRRVNDQRVLYSRAWYFNRIYADTQDADTVYVLNVSMMRSTDGGKSFVRVPTPHADNHDLWILPTNSNWMINSNDGGANVSFNGGRSWSSQENQPTGQFFRVIADHRFPYFVYGAQQDNNNALAVASRTDGAGIGPRDWYRVGGGESGFIGFDPKAPNLIYAGANMNWITEYDHHSKQIRNIMAYPEQGLGRDARDLRYRFNWNAPILVSKHNPKVIYHAANVLLRSENRGQTWEEVSPDLTRNEKDKQGPGGGPITGEGAGGEYYNTILYVAESPHEAGTLWVGTDDGLVHLTGDGGQSWRNVTPDGIGRWQVNAIEVSPHDPATAYIAVTGYRLNDRSALILKTQDYGGSWKRIVRGLRDGDFVRVVREDPDRPGLLYAGTETGVAVSFNAGELWQSLRLNLPAVPVTDLTVRNGDLVASTDGRGFWILDDLSPLQQIGDEVARADMYLFKPRNSYRMRGASVERPGWGKNPPNGAVIDYYLAKAPGVPITLEILDGGGNLIRSFSTQLPADPGMNRFVWDHRHHDVTLIPGTFLAAQFFGTVPGYKVPPGTYRAKLSKGETTLTQTFEVLKDPRALATLDDLEEQAVLLAAIRENVNEIHESVMRMQKVRDQVRNLIETSAGHEKAGLVEAQGDALIRRIEAWEENLIQPRHEGIMDAISFPTMLNEQFLFLKGAVASADAPPTDGSRTRFEDLEASWLMLKAEMKRLLEEDLAAFNKLYQENDIPAVIVPR